MQSDIDKLKYPIGRFQRPTTITPEMLESYITTIATFPARLSAALEGFSEDDLNTPYRPEGWSIRQVVHHCADSHMNSLMRYKLALTEDIPTIKPYFEDRWASLPDSKSMGIESAFLLLEGLHAKWAFLLKNMTEADFKRTFFHPEQQREIPLDVTTALYAWHCDHHLGHVKLVG